MYSCTGNGSKRHPSFCVSCNPFYGGEQRSGSLQYPPLSSTTLSSPRPGETTPGRGQNTHTAVRWILCVLGGISSPCLLPLSSLLLESHCTRAWPQCFLKLAISYHFCYPTELQGPLSAPPPGFWTGMKKSSPLLLTIHNALSPHVSSTNVSNVSHGESFIRIDWLSCVQTFVEH